MISSPCAVCRLPVGSSASKSLRARNHRPRHPDELLLAARKLIRVEVLLAHDAEAVERVGHQRLPLRRRQIAIAERHLQVLRDRQIVEQVVLLEDEADGAARELGALLRAQGLHLLAVQFVLAGPGLVEHAQDGQERRLARAGRAHDGDEVAVGDVEVDAPQEEELTCALLHRLLDVAQLDHLRDLQRIAAKAMQTRRADLRRCEPYDDCAQERHHSARSAEAGSTLVARRAGNSEAIAATRERPAATAA